MQTILLVEDHDTMHEALAYSLTQEGYRVVQTSKGTEALDLVRERAPDLVVVNVRLPSDGLFLCRMIRYESDVVIMILTAHYDEVDHIVALEIGADDYLVRPIRLAEFLWRVRAVLRRAPSYGTASNPLKAGDLTLDLTARRVICAGQELRMTYKEFELLAMLVSHEGVVLSRAFLLKRVWKTVQRDRFKTIDVHVHRLREKIENDPSYPRRIVTVRGIGYRFDG